MTRNKANVSSKKNRKGEPARVAKPIRRDKETMIFKNGIWRPNTKSKIAPMLAFDDTMSSVECLVRQASGWTGEREIRRDAKMMSVPLRKLIDRDDLLNRCLDGPRFHALSEPHRTDSLFDLRMNKTISYKKSPKDEFLWTTNTEDQISIRSLLGYGLSGDKDGSWEIYSDIFRIDVEPTLKLRQWLGQPLLKILDDDTEKVFSLGDIVKYVANTEGAHTDDYETGQKELSKAKASKYLEAIGRPYKFSYPHLVTVFVGIYLHNRHMRGIVEHKHEWVKEIDPNRISERIAYACLTGRTPNPDWQRKVIPLGVNLDAPEQPPPRHQKHRWVIMHGTEQTPKWK